MNTDQLLHEVRDTLLDVVDDLNAMLPRAEWIDRSTALVLHGDESRLDSIMLINLLVAAEEKLNERLGRAPALTVVVMETDPALLRTLDDLARLATTALERSG